MSVVFYQVIIMSMLQMFLLKLIQNIHHVFLLKSFRIFFLRLFRGSLKELFRECIQLYLQIFFSKFPNFQIFKFHVISQENGLKKYSECSGISSETVPEITARKSTSSSCCRVFTKTNFHQFSKIYLYK